MFWLLKSSVTLLMFALSLTLQHNPFSTANVVLRGWEFSQENPGASTTKADDTYVLPYPKGASYKLLQGYNGPYGHKGHAEFAYDFQMAFGTPVMAARGGEVVKVVESNSDSTRVPGQENVVVIRHSDGTFARYYHLTKDGALIAVGEKVAQGDKIALSGDSGATAGPHLHFDVTKGCYDWGCQTVATQFVNAAENPLKQGQVYEALAVKR